MRSWLLRTCLYLLLPAASFASVRLDFTLTSLGGNSYRYNYSIFNDGSIGPGVPVQLFDVLFDPLLYDESSLQIVTQPPLSTQWSELILASVPGLPAAYDALALSGGIPVGATVSGFAVQFKWLGTGIPGAQPFEVSNPTNFQVLQLGNSDIVGGSAVPEPSTLGLAVLALVTGTYRMRRRSYPRPSNN